MASSARDAPDLDGEAEVDLGRYSRALLARWWLLLVGLVVGAVIGSCENAERLILGLHDVAGTLRVVGSTVLLKPSQRTELREHLFTALEHPWPSELSAGAIGHWGGGVQLIHRVEPTLVVEVYADRALDHGRWRHLTRYVRTRPDVEPASVRAG